MAEEIGYISPKAGEITEKAITGSKWMKEWLEARIQNTEGGEKNGQEEGKRIQRANQKRDDLERKSKELERKSKELEEAHRDSDSRRSYDKGTERIQTDRGVLGYRPSEEPDQGRSKGSRTVNVAVCVQRGMVCDSSKIRKR